MSLRHQPHAKSVPNAAEEVKVGKSDALFCITTRTDMRPLVDVLLLIRWHTNKVSAREKFMQITINLCHPLQHSYKNVLAIALCLTSKRTQIDRLVLFRDPESSMVRDLKSSVSFFRKKLPPIGIRLGHLTPSCYWTPLLSP